MATWRAGFDAYVDKPVAAATLASITQRFGGRLSGRSHERRSA